MIQKIQQPLFLFFFFGFIALSLFGDVASHQYFPNTGGDFLNHLTAIIQAKIAFQAGQFPIRIAPLEHGGWGYPFYQFYGSTPYTLGGWIYQYLTPHSAMSAFKIVAWTTLTLGAIFIYRLVSWLIPSQPIALLTGASYLLSPYFIILINSGGCYTEIFALNFIPMTVYYSLRCCLTENALPSLLLLSVSWFVLITTHPVTFVYTSLFLGFFIFLLAFYKIYAWEKCILISASYVLGCLLAMWVLDPIITLGSSLEINHTLSDPGQYNLASTLPSLITPQRVSPQYLLGGQPTLNPAYGWPVLLSIFACFYAWITRQLNPDELSTKLIKPLLLLFTLVFFLIWSPFHFWPFLPKIFRVGQYCWRLFEQALWIDSLLFAYGLYWLFGKNFDKRHLMLGLLILGLSAGSWIPRTFRHPTSLAEVNQKPYFSFSQFAYLLLPHDLPLILNKTILYTIIDQKGLLKKHKSSILPSKLLTDFPSLLLHIEGELPHTIPGDIKVFANHRLIGSHSLSRGHFSWDLPLAKLIHTSAASIHLSLKAPPALYPIPLQMLSLTNYDPKLRLLSVNKTEKYCSHLQGGSLLQCDINVPANINMLELPFLYYPEMTKSTLNHQPIQLHPVLNDNVALVGVAPLPGVKNHISIQFTGNSWANHISVFAWILWGLGWMSLFILKMQGKVT